MQLLWIWFTTQILTGTLIILDIITSSYLWTVQKEKCHSCTVYQQPPLTGREPSPQPLTDYRKRRASCSMKSPLEDISEIRKVKWLLLWAGQEGRDFARTWNLTEVQKNEPKSYWDGFQLLSRKTTSVWPDCNSVPASRHPR